VQVGAHTPEEDEGGAEWHPLMYCTQPRSVGGPSQYLLHDDDDDDDDDDDKDNKLIGQLGLWAPSSGVQDVFTSICRFRQFGVGLEDGSCY